MEQHTRENTLNIVVDGDDDLPTFLMTLFENYVSEPGYREISLKMKDGKFIYIRFIHGRFTHTMELTGTFVVFSDVIARKKSDLQFGDFVVADDGHGGSFQKGKTRESILRPFFMSEIIKKFLPRIESAFPALFEDDLLKSIIKNLKERLRHCGKIPDADEIVERIGRTELKIKSETVFGRRDICEEEHVYMRYSSRTDDAHGYSNFQDRSTVFLNFVIANANDADDLEDICEERERVAFVMITAVTYMIIFLFIENFLGNKHGK